jgi:predicted Rossmann fold flavoprotein
MPWRKGLDNAKMRTDVIVIGGGAAGLFCAFQAGKRGRATTVLERAAVVGNKIAISGGGRCNFTNLHAGPAYFICGNPHFHKSALARFGPRNFVELAEKHGIGYHEKMHGQLFCDGSARQIIRMLLAECAAARVDIRTKCHVHSVEKKDRFLIATDQGNWECESVVIATGGLALPRLGATDFGYRVARQFGLKLVPTKPALVPLTLTEHDRAVLSPLSGIAVEALVSLRDQQFRENILVTHRGLSGPSILQISSYWNPAEAILIDLMPDVDAVEWLECERKSGKQLRSLLSRYWPRRFAEAWTQIHVESKPMRTYSDREVRSIVEGLHRWRITPSGTEGYSTAEVTAGGVDTAELSSQTMGVLRVPGLHFVGEVVDVTGQLGGFNFQWAWASGFAAAQSV